MPPIFCQLESRLAGGPRAEVPTGNRDSISLFAGDSLEFRQEVCSDGKEVLVLNRCRLFTDLRRGLLCQSVQLVEGHVSPPLVIGHLVMTANEFIERKRLGDITLVRQKERGDRQRAEHRASKPTLNTDGQRMINSFLGAERFSVGAVDKCQVGVYIAVETFLTTACERLHGRLQPGLGLLKAAVCESRLAQKV